MGLQSHNSDLCKSVAALSKISCCCQVRLAFLQMVADWMLTLRERIDHHARLMPYALSALVRFIK